MVSSYPTKKTNQQRKHAPGKQTFRPPGTPRRTPRPPRRTPGGRPLKYGGRIRPVPFAPPAPARAPVSRAAFAGLKTVAKLNPYIRGASFVYDVYDFYKHMSRQKASPGEGYDWTGWELYRDCGTPEHGIASSARHPCGNALRLVLQSAWETEEGKVLRTSGYDYANCYRDLSFIVSGGTPYARFRQSNRYRKKVNSGDPLSEITPIQGRLALPVPSNLLFKEPWPIGLLPAMQPINEFRPTPNQLPWEIIPLVRRNPNVPKQTQRQAGYSVGSKPWQPGDPIIFPNRPPRANETPMVYPPVVIAARPLTQAQKDRVLNRYHKQVPKGQPRPQANREKTKERKLRSTRIINFIASAGSAMGEVFDYIDIFYDALPDEYKPRFVDKNGRVTPFAAKNPKAVDKMRALYDHWDKVDLPKAIRGIGDNIAEDAAYGTIGEFAAKASRQGMGPFGHSRGPGLQYGDAHKRWMMDRWEKSLEED